MPAAADSGVCPSPQVNPDPIPMSADPIKVTITTPQDCFVQQDGKPGGSYFVRLFQGNGTDVLFNKDGQIADTARSLSFTLPGNTRAGTWTLQADTCNAYGTPLGCTGATIFVLRSIVISDVNIKPNITTDKTTYRAGDTANITIGNIHTGTPYSLYWNTSKDKDEGFKDIPLMAFNGTPDAKGEQQVSIVIPDAGTKDWPLCIAVTNQDPTCVTVHITNLPTLKRDDQLTCTVQGGNAITFRASDVVAGQDYNWWDCHTTVPPIGCVHNVQLNPGDSELSFSVPTGDAGQKKVCIDVAGSYNEDTANCLNFTVTAEQTDNTSCAAQNGGDSLTPSVTPRPPLPPCAAKLQAEAGPSQTPLQCDAVMTGLGIPFWTSPAEFVTTLFTFLLSISGMILLLLILYSGYQLMTSHGDQEKIKVARERITSAIVGFMFLVFSLVILQVIGVDILRLPGFCGDNNNCQKADLSVPTPIPTEPPQGTIQSGKPH